MLFEKFAEISRALYHCTFYANNMLYVLIYVTYLYMYIVCVNASLMM